MKVICRGKFPSEAQNVVLGYNRDNTTGFELTVGKEYTVLGVSYQTTAQLNRGVVLLLRDDIGRCAFVPICLLDVSNDCPSKYWRAQKKGDFDLCFWPEEFFEEFFHDDLSDGVAHIKEAWDRVCQALDSE